MLRPLTRLFLLLAAAGTLLLSPALAQEAEPLAVSAPEAEPTVPGPQPLRVLFLGNSYTQHNKLPLVVQALAASARIPVEMEVESRTPGGCTFERHWIEGRSVDLIREGGWDVVVLQEQSRLPITDPLLMHRNGKKLIAEIRKVGARPLLFMTWARRDQPETTEGLESAYCGLAKQTGAEVAPVGLAWRDALDQKPHWGLHQTDGSHPNMRGTYLAACVLLGWIADVDPRSLGDVGRRELVPEEMAFLHDIAVRHVPASAALPMVRELRTTRVESRRVALKWSRFEGRPAALRVERRIAEGEENGFSLVAGLKGSATGWTDKDVQPATAYAYRIYPVFAEKKLSLKSSGVSRKLKLGARIASRVELSVERGVVEWTVAGERIRLAAGELRLLELEPGLAVFEAEAVAVATAATGIARLIPVEKGILAIPPFLVVTKAE